jgi:hypothetical protein
MTNELLTERIIDGVITQRRFAYVGRTGDFGLLLAVDRADARESLGLNYRIRETWITPADQYIQRHNIDRRWELVESAFTSESPTD